MINNKTKYPDVAVKLSGSDGNAFSIMGKVTTALRKGGAAKEAVTEFQTEAMSGDYDHLLQVCMRWVNVS